MELRKYQQDAVDAVYQYLRTHDGSPLIVCPTGSGKGLIVSQIAVDVVTRWNGRVLILSHVRELLEQNFAKIRSLCGHVPAGLYSAGLNQRCTDTPIVVAGIQSVYRRAAELGPFDVAVIDECHMLSDDDDTMYGQFLRETRQVGGHTRLVGATASPFRMTSGLIYGPGKRFSDICYEIGVKELIQQGYLSPLVSKAGQARVDTSNLHVRGGEFVAEEVEQLMNQGDLVEAACREIIELTRERKKVLIFAAGVTHGLRIERRLRELSSEGVAFLSAMTPSHERAELIARFRDERDGLLPRDPLKYLVNVGILLVGFDAPAIDCVALLRPTNSCGLYLQAVGRGFRLSPGKQDCLVLDFAGNIERHGPVDSLKPQEKNRREGNGDAPAKECPECRAVVAAGFATCPQCGHSFPPPEKQSHEGTASQAAILSGQATVTNHEVRDVHYRVHLKRGAPDDAPRSMRVEYRLGFNSFVSEWICFEHDGYARQKAVGWWQARSNDPVPDTAERAVELAECGALAPTKTITVRTVAGEAFERIVDYELGEIPEPADCDGVASVDLADVPF